MRSKNLHFICGIVISIYISLHLANHIVRIFGAESHIRVMNLLRIIYRNPIVESILLLSILVQIITGIKQFFLLRNRASCFYPKLQIWSGLYLALFFFIHLAAIFVGRYFLQLDTNFYFGVAGLNAFPFYLFFLPYYGLAIMSFFSHVAVIHFCKMKRTPFGISVNNQSGFILTIGVIVTIIILYGLSNGFNGVEIPKEYNILIGK